jgi:hypothetical protein
MESCGDCFSNLAQLPATRRPSTVARPPTEPRSQHKSTAYCYGGTKRRFFERLVAAARFSVVSAQAAPLAASFRAIIRFRNCPDCA